MRTVLPKPSRASLAMLGACGAIAVVFSAADTAGMDPRGEAIWGGVVGTLIVAALVLPGAVRRLSRRPAVARAPLSSLADLAAVQAILAEVGQGSAHLALAGDKRLLFSPSRRSFLMFDVFGRSWIALGDPVGEAAESAALIADFLQRCAAGRGRPAFYRVAAAHLALYAGHGLSAVKMGEEARVALDGNGASLSGIRRKSLRYGRMRAEREGCRFEMVAPDAVPALLPALRAVSNAWLAGQGAREKRFSVGRFDPDYLAHSPLAVVRRDGVPVAFASVWLWPATGEIAPDLMRRDPVGPYGAMDFLFAELMAWGAAQGYRTLNLGLAPLAGTDDQALPASCRLLSALARRSGGRFYNFGGLRGFKDKFSPEWQPRYLVSRDGFALPVAILDAARLIAGGVGGMVGR